MTRITLLEYARRYVRLMDSSDGYFDQFRFTISRFEQWAGREFFIDELTEDAINGYIAETKESLSSATRRSRRNMLLRLWRHALRDKTLDSKPRPLDRDRIGKVRMVYSAPQAWSLQKVQMLLQTADELRGLYKRRISKRLFWRAYVLAVWSTGLRRCDLMQLQRADIPPTGHITMIQVKTGRPVVGILDKAAMQAINELCDQHKLPTVFPLWCKLPTWRKIAKRLVKKANIGLSIGHLRHSAGTNVENRFPGKGPQFLGNTPEVFYRNYYDRTLAEDLPNPYPLTGK